MKAQSSSNPSADWERSPEPGWLQSDAGALFCWYHAPAGNQRDVAVLLCDPLGSDRMNLHLAYRHLALALSKAGFPTLRLDYPSTCDSEGIPRDKNRLGAIFGALHAGANYLKQRSGARTLALFGARFGGTLAYGFASQREDVSLAGSWGAYPGGRQFLRNETAFDRLSHANPDQLKPSSWVEGDVEAAGFLYSGETVSDLRALSLADLKTPPVTEAFLVPWEIGETSGDISALLKNNGIEVTEAEAADSGAQSLQRQRVPRALINGFCTWLEARSTPQDLTPPTAELLSAEVALSAGNGRSIRERCVQFGEQKTLFGILTEPGNRCPSSTHYGIILVNGGNNHRAGINRNYTEWARQWADQGFTVLRMDIRGLGDSPPVTPSELNRLYLSHTRNDLDTAADWLQHTQGVDQLIFCGLCAGAYQVLQLTRKRSDIHAILLLELLRYYSWEPLQAQKSPAMIRVRRYWSRFHPMWLLDRNRLGKWLSNLCNAGTRCLVVYRKDERMLMRFRDEISARKDLLETTGNFQLSELGSSNHIISPLWAQEELSNLLMNYLKQLKTD